MRYKQLVEVFEDQVSTYQFKQMVREFPCKTAPVEAIIRVTTLTALKATFAAMREHMAWRSSTLDGIGEKRREVADMIRCRKGAVAEKLDEITCDNVTCADTPRIILCLDRMMQLAGRISGLPGLDRMQHSMEELLEEVTLDALDTLRIHKADRIAHALQGNVNH